MLFDGRNRIRFPYSRYGYTRGNGKVWHGGVDVDGLDDSIIHFPTYHNKSILFCSWLVDWNKTACSSVCK